MTPNDLDKKNQYKIGVLDFGILYEIKTTKDAIFYLLSNLKDTHPEELAKKTLFSGIIEPVECLEKLNVQHYKNDSFLIVNLMKLFLKTIFT